MKSPKRCSSYACLFLPKEIFFFVIEKNLLMTSESDHKRTGTFGGPGLGGKGGGGGFGCGALAEIQTRKSFAISDSPHLSPPRTSMQVYH